MATIIVECSWPVTSTEQLTIRWKEMKELPEWLVMAWCGSKSEVNFGIRGLALYQCHKDRIDNALAFIREDVARYFTVPGFSFSVDIWTEPEAALKMVGLA